MRVAVVALLLVGTWAAPAPDKSPAALYGAPAPRDCPLQRVEAATGDGCQESQECDTQYEEKCSTVEDEKCESVYESQCQTVYDDKCNTVYDDKCETVYNTVYDDKCDTA